MGKRPRGHSQMPLEDDATHRSNEEKLNGVGDDSNAFILPPRQKNKFKTKNKGSAKFKERESAKMSKSQMRKLKKLQENKEKAVLMSEVFETLAENKIPDNKLSLLQSSHKIGQSETRKEKRWKATQYSKAGLEVPDYWPSKKSKGNDDSSMHELELDSDSHQSSHVVETKQTVLPTTDAQKMSRNSMSLSSQEDSLCGNELVRNGEQSAVLPDRDDVNKSLPVEKDSRNLPSASLISTMQLVEEMKVDTNNATDSSGHHLPRTLVAPTVVHVSRPNDVENKRKDLPIIMMEQEIMEAINDHPTVIICGETGCGKTTQVPQFLYEAGYSSTQDNRRKGIIGVTQPRRVAVLATAKRVAYELGFCLGKDVGFQVRHDKMIGKDCSIKFMTDGILLREVQNEFLLTQYSVIILDEAHERSLNTDILIGMLSRVVQLRQKRYEDQQRMVVSGRLSPQSVIPPLKLVLMSATLRVDDFVSERKLFLEVPPVVEVPTRQYPVTVHFSKRTELVDYIGQAYKKVLSIHKRLPPGGILVFVTGQREVEFLCKKLRKAYRDIRIHDSSKRNIEYGAASVPEVNAIEGVDMKEIDDAFGIRGRNPSQHESGRFSSYDDDHLISEVESDFSNDSGTESDLDYDFNSDSLSVEDSENMPSTFGDENTLVSLKAAFESFSGNTATTNTAKTKKTAKMSKKKEIGCGTMCVLPLYAMLPASAQLRVFEEIKDGERLVVVATNVAETSLTIPGIKYVVDTGREKVKNYNLSNGIETYQVQWISKASAAQRAGRAGRTTPGHCYRLYSSAVFNNTFPDFAVAEIAKTPIDGVVLLLKSIGIDKVNNFPFPTRPNDSALREAENCLKVLEALDVNGKLTLLGRAMAHYPMSPRHSRMLLTVIQIMRKDKDYARANLILGYAVAVAAALSLSNPFIFQSEGGHGDNSGKDEKLHLQAEEKKKKKELKETVKVVRARFGNPSSDALTIAYALQCFELSESPVQFCIENLLHLKTMEEMSKLRKQLLQLVFNQNVLRDLEQKFFWTCGSMEDVENAWKVSSHKHPLLVNEEELLCQAICAGWADRVAKRTRGSTGLRDGDKKVNAVRYQASIVDESVFLHRWSSLSQSSPEFIVYNELLHTKRPYMHGATTVKPDCLVKYAGSLCSFSAPLDDPKPYYEPLSDQVRCWVIPTYGAHLWQLPLYSLPISSTLDRVTVFGYALLEGQVLPCLKSVCRLLAASPSSMLRQEAQGQRRVSNLLSALNMKSRPIDCCARLKEVWLENPKKLYAEILDWFQDSFRGHFEEIWSEMKYEALLDPEERFRKKMKKKKSL